MNILLIEDERKTIQYIKKGLEEHGYEVDTAEDGKSGKNLAFRNEYNLIITDVIMPELSGTELCKELRDAKNETPILMLTALGDTDDVVAGLDSGADDYLASLLNLRNYWRASDRLRSVSLNYQLMKIKFALQT
jgi:two-component system copper resistance phosphate regulon response regulator CusR